VLKHEGVDLSQRLAKEQLREVAPTPQMLPTVKRLFKEQYYESHVKRDQADHHQRYV